MSDRFGSISIDPVTPGPSPPPRPERPQKKTLPPSRPSKSGGKLPKTLLACLLLLFLAGSYAAVGLWGIPKYIRATLPEKLKNQTGLSLELGRVEFNPLSFDLNISDIIIREEGNQSPELLTLTSFQADLAPVHLLRGELVTTRLLLDTLELNLIRTTDGKYNFAGFLQSGKSSTAADILDFSELPFLFSLNNVSVNNGKIIFEDGPQKSTHTIEQITLTLPNLSNFSFQANEYIHPSFSAIINGSPIELTGKAVLSGDGESDDGLETHLACNFNAIDLSLYFDYLPFDLPLDITQGKADGTLQLTFMPSAREDKLSVEFAMQATDLEMITDGQEFALKVPSAQFEGSIQPVTGDAHFKNIVFREPSVRAATTPLKKLGTLFPVSAHDNPFDGTTQRTPELTIDRLLADNGTLSLSRDNQKNPVERWEAIQISLKNYTNISSTQETSTRSSFRISGEHSDTQATYSWQGHIDGHNLPAGDLHIDNIGVATLFDWLEVKDIQSSTGTADGQGYLRFEKSSGKEPVITPYIEEGTLTFHDLALTEHGDTWYTAPVTKIAGFSKAGRAISLGSVYLKNSLVTLNTDVMPTFLQNISAKESPLSLEALEFSGTITLANEDQRVPDLQFTKATLQAIHLSSQGKTPDRDNLTFKATLEDKGEIQAQGKIQLNSFAASMHVGFSNLNSAKLLPWFSTNSLLSQTTSLLHGKGTFTFPYVSFNGQIQLRNGQLMDQDTPYFTWENIEFDDFRYNRKPLHLGATSCSIEAPQLTWSYSPESRHVASALVTFMQHSLPQKDLPKSATTTRPPLEIQAVNITSGTLNFTDHRLTPAWKAAFTDIQGTLEEITADSTAPASRFSFAGQLDSIAFSLDGSIHLLNKESDGEAEFVLHDYPLPSFHEQLSNQVDIDSSRGDVAVTVRDTWQNGSIMRNSNLTFTHLEPLSERADSALPLALLTDAEHKFQLTIDKKRNLDNDSVPVFAEAVTAFKKLMIKASVSPLLLTTGNFTDLAGMEFAEFLPGQVVLSGSGRESLARFSSLLSNYPWLGLRITGSADATIDVEAMKQDLEKAEQLRVKKENRRRSNALEKATQEHVRKLAEARLATGPPAEIVELDIPPELYQRYAPIQPEPVIIDDSMLQNLASERARVIVDFFTDQLALQKERITLAPHPRITESSEDSGSQGNRVLFTIGTFTRSENNSPVVPTNMAY